MLSNIAARDVETLVHPYTNLATFRETGPFVLERGKVIEEGDHDTLIRIHGGVYRRLFERQALELAKGLIDAPPRTLGDGAESPEHRAAV